MQQQNTQYQLVDKIREKYGLGTYMHHKYKLCPMYGDEASKLKMDFLGGINKKLEICVINKTNIPYQKWHNKCWDMHVKITKLSNIYDKTDTFKETLETYDKNITIYANSIYNSTSFQEAEQYASALTQYHEKCYSNLCLASKQVLDNFEMDIMGRSGEWAGEYGG